MKVAAVQMSGVPGNLEANLDAIASHARIVDAIASIVTPAPFSIFPQFLRCAALEAA